MAKRIFNLQLSSVLHFSLWFTLVIIIMLGAGIRANAQGFSVSPPTFELSLSPGAKYTGYISVDNSSDETSVLKVYLNDWRQTEKGDQFLEVGEEPQSLSQWMRISPTQLTIPPGGSEKVYFEITMPQDTNLSGSYWSICFMEGQPGLPIQLKPKGEQGPTIGIMNVFRFGIKVFVTIPGTEIRQAEFTGNKLSPAKGGFDMTATLENQGNIYLRPHVWIELRDQMGMTVYSETHKETRVLPNSKCDYSFELRELNLPPGRYTALIIADYDAPNLVAVQAEIEIKPAPPAKGGGK